MKNVSKISFCFLTINALQNYAKNYHQEHFTSTTKIIINGKEFSHAKQSDNGVMTEQFLVNRVPVEKDQYIQALNATKLAQMNDQEKETQRKADDQQALRTNLQQTLLQKLVTQELINLQENLAILEEPILKPYFSFDSKGIPSATEHEQLKNFTSQTHKK